MRSAGVRPSKALGQHFLTDRNVVTKLVNACELSADDTLIEIGPGLGVVTERLAARAGRVIAVEIDANLAGGLGDRLREAKNLTIVEADVLAVSPTEVLLRGGLPPDTAYSVVGNLPYNIGTAILRHFLEAPNPPRWLTVMLQREVAASIVGAPGKLGLLAISVRIFAQPRRLFNVPPAAFYPPPKVVSSVIRLDVRPEPLVPLAERDHFFAMLRAGFSAPRKQLRNSLAQGLGLEPADVFSRLDAAGIDPRQRPEELSIDDWLRLSRRIEAAA